MPVAPSRLRLRGERHRISPGVTAVIPVAGRAGIPPAGAAAVVLRVAVIRPSGSGELVVHPGTTAPSEDTALPFKAGRSTTRLAVTALSEGAAAVTNRSGGRVRVIVHLLGWFAGQPREGVSALVPVSPTRLLDVRAGRITAAGGRGTLGRLRAAGRGRWTVTLPVTGQAGVPRDGVAAVALNVTTHTPSAAGTLTIRSGGRRGRLPSLRLEKGELSSTLLLVPVGSGGRITIAGSRSAERVAIDLTGWFTTRPVPGMAAFQPLDPTRLLDTRAPGGGAIEPGGQRDVAVAGRGGLPAQGIRAVLLQVAAVHTQTAGSLLVFPSGTGRPRLPSVSFAPGAVGSNLVVARLGPDGRVSVANDSSAAVQATVDVVGWFQEAPPLEPPTVQVDATVAPRILQAAPGTDGAARPVGALTDAAGHQADFVSNELLLAAGPSELAEFRRRWGGQVVQTIDLERLRSGAGAIYLLRVDTTRTDIDTLPGSLQALLPLATGAYRVSSQEALRLLALATQAAAAGHRVGVNLAAYASGYEDRSLADAPAGPPNWSRNAFDWPWMRAGSVQNIGVTEAWRALALAGRLGNRIPIAILDGGFANDPELPPGSTGADGLPNPGQCAGGPCPWHGLRVAVTATGLPDNGRGAAGTGGPVARALMYPSPQPPASPSQHALAMFTSDTLTNAMAAFVDGAKVVNMSFTASVPWAFSGVTFPLNLFMILMSQAGVVPVAAAGNGQPGINVDEVGCAFWIFCQESTVVVPCELAGVVCVGGLAHNQRRPDPGSNYGPEDVDIWAPYTVAVGPDPDHPANVATYSHGTSYSAPYVSGVLALFQAAGRSANQAAADLIRYAQPGLGQARRIVKADRPVFAHLGNQPPGPLVIRTPGRDGERFRRGLEFVAQAAVDDPDHTATIDQVTWTLDSRELAGSQPTIRTGELGAGQHVLSARLIDGPYTLTARRIFVVARAPEVEIVSPRPDQAVYLGGHVNLRAVVRHDTTLRDDQLAWYVDDATTPIAHGHNQLVEATRLGLGTHRLRLVATDQLGDQGTSEVTIRVLRDPANVPPTPRILLPVEDGWVFFTLGPPHRALIRLRGEGVDQEDGRLPDDRLSWTVTGDHDGDGRPETLHATGPSSDLTVTISGPDTMLRFFTAELTVTDANGASVTDRVQFRVGHGLG